MSIQKALKAVAYTDPLDLFLNGVTDTRRGTRGNMAALHVALGWRLGWPVSLAWAGHHIICRYDDGQVVHNIEATNNGKGGFHSHPDAYYRQQYNIPDEAIRRGSDLHAATPLELLGMFLGLRARHWHDAGRFAEARRDYLLARDHFPNSRLLSQHAADALETVPRVRRFMPRGAVVRRRRTWS